MYKAFLIGKTIFDNKNVKGGNSMRNRKINRMNKEKIAMIVSSLLIVTTCTLTGVYINGKEKAKEKEQVVDFAELEDTENQTAKQEEIVPEKYVTVPQQIQKDTNNTFIEQDLDVDPMYQETNSDSIINPEFPSAIGNVEPTETIESTQSTEPGESKDATDTTGEEQKKSDELENEQDKNDTQSSKISETMNNSVALFSESEKLSWPVQGEVLINYSMDKTVHFATLNQYKYNPALVIKSEPQSSVKAPYSGTIKDVGSNTEIGNYIVMDLGNNYELTLGQLENLSVKKGDTVKSSQVIGKTASPSKYYSVEGSNIYMKLTKDGNTVNPMDFLES